MAKNFDVFAAALEVNKIQNKTFRLLDELCHGTIIKGRTVRKPEEINKEHVLYELMALEQAVARFKSLIENA